MATSEISFYIDTLLVETVLSNPNHFYKKGGFVTDLLTKVKEYFSSKIDPKRPVASVLNELAPGAIWLLFKSLGIGKWGLLLSLLMSVFHVDVSGMISSLYEKVKEMISGGNKVSSRQIDSAVQGVVQEHSQTSGEQEAQEGYDKLQQMQQSVSSPADDGAVYSSLDLLYDAKIISLALVEYERQNMRLIKDAVPRTPASFLSGYSGTKAKGTSLLGSILGWIFKLALAAAGIMLAGDIVNKLFGRPNSLDGTYQAGKPGGVGSTEVSTGPTQTKYHLIGDAPLPRAMPIVNTFDNIGNMIIQFAKDVYSGLDGKESLIRNTAGYNVIKRRIAMANIYNPGSSSIMIPPEFTSKKQLVDYFIDDVAKADVG